MENGSTNKSQRRERTISVIVPIYNVERYLPCCIDSILAQTFTDFELILVDDGSPDNCGAICDEYAQNDDRIVVIHQENGGLSAARNTGLDWVFANSSSQWITFVDSDDYIARRYLEMLYNYAIQYSADIASMSSTLFENDTELNNIPDIVSNVADLAGAEACRSIYLRDGRVSVMVWGKLFQKTLFAQHRFPVGKVHEDDALVPQLLHEAKRVVAMRAWMYGNRVRQGSIINSGFSLRRFERIEGIDSCIDAFHRSGDAETEKCARKFRNEVCATTVLRAWKYKMAKDIPQPYKMSVIRAIYLTLRDSVKRGGVKLIFERLKIFK